MVGEGERHSTLGGRGGGELRLDTRNFTWGRGKIPVFPDQLYQTLLEPSRHELQGLIKHHNIKPRFYTFLIVSHSLAYD